MNILLFGMPASGKGTQAQTIANFLNLKIISMGTLLRHHRSSSTILNQGNLVSNEIIEEVLNNILKDSKDNLLFDGVPRNLEQAKLLHEKFHIKIDLIIELQIQEEVAISRIANRLIHKPSGRTYNLETNPPQRPGLDDVTLEPLEKRQDDTVDIMKYRIKVYHELTKEVLNFFLHNDRIINKPQYLQIQGEQTVDQVSRQIIHYLEYTYISNK